MSDEGGADWKEAVPAVQGTSGMTRREFGGKVLAAGWWALALAGARSLFALVRFFIPRAVYTPPATFLAGRPEDYAPGEVSPK